MKKRRWIKVLKNGQCVVMPDLVTKESWAQAFDYIKQQQNNNEK